MVCKSNPKCAGSRGNCSAPPKPAKAQPKADKRHAQNVARLERYVTADKQFLTGMGLRYTMLFALLGMLQFYVLSSAFHGVVVARLPFTPFTMFSFMTHRGLEGTDLREAGWLVFFVLGNMGIKPLVTRLIGKPGTAGGGAFDFSKIFADASQQAE